MVVSFLQAAARHDAATAIALLSPLAAAHSAQVVAPLWGPNTISLTEIVVDGVRPDPLVAGDAQPGFTDITQVTVEATIQFADIGKAGMSNGRNTWFAYVGHTPRAMDWRILGIGGGP